MQQGLRSGEWVAVALLVAGMFVALALVSSPRGQGNRLLVLGAPGAGESGVMRTLKQSDVRLLGTGGLPFVVVVEASGNENARAELYRAGAWLVLEAGWFGACFVATDL